MRSRSLHGSGRVYWRGLLMSADDTAIGDRPCFIWQCFMIRHKSFVMSVVWTTMWTTMQSVRFVYVFWVWISGGTKKIVNICLLSLQKHKNILHSILLQFSPNLLFYTVLKHQIQPFPTLSHGSNLFPPFP